jgi:TPR repeat protein
LRRRESRRTHNAFEQLGVPRDLGQFIFWATKAATQGLPIAQYYVGEAYRTGKGVVPEKRLSRFWLQSAATNHYAPALFSLAIDFAAEKTNKGSLFEANRYMLQAAQYGLSG